MPRKSGRGFGPLSHVCGIPGTNTIGVDSVISVDSVEASLCPSQVDTTKVRESRRRRDAATRAAASRTAAHLRERVRVERNMATCVTVAQAPAPILTLQVAALFAKVLSRDFDWK